MDIHVGRPTEVQVVASFLDAAARTPAGLVLEGEPGIGKTALWLTGLEQARKRGFHVLAARPVDADSQLAYAAVADLLRGVDAGLREGLPAPQRRALDRALLHEVHGDGTATDRHAVGAALLSVLEQLSDETPLLLAVDDTQWLDRSSAHALAFAVRRLTGAVGVLMTSRIEADGSAGVPWLRTLGIDALRRTRLPPLGPRDLHRVVTEHTGRTLAPPILAHIHHLSRGNPFYALELARALDADPGGLSASALPDTLTELVAARLAVLHPDVLEVLLAAAAVADPTVEIVESAVGAGVGRVVRLLEAAESSGVLRIDGHRLRFTHPLLAAGVYHGAPPARRRSMHRRLAEVPEVAAVAELRARHLALAAVHGDSTTLAALDESAATARDRGAPTAAAELLGLAIGLAGETPDRLVALAGNLLDAGDTERARSILERTTATLPPGPTRAQAWTLQALVRMHDDSYAHASALLEQALAEAGGDTALRLRIFVMLSYALVNQGRAAEALAHLDAAAADRAPGARSGIPGQVLGMRVVLRFLAGHGVDDANMRLALALAEPDAHPPPMFDATVQSALLQAWTGDLTEAATRLLTVRRRCHERGAEQNLVFVEFHRGMIECWRGNPTGVALIADDAMERALQLGTDVPLAVAHLLRALTAVHSGQEAETRAAVAESAARFERCGWRTLAGWPVMILGFLEVSLGRHEEAVVVLDPMLDGFRAAPEATEIVSAAFLPDAVEALVAVGRVADAEDVVAALEGNGRRLDRAWMLAVGGRGRALLRAAAGDINGARAAAEQALAEHRRLSMPFEEARTRLVIGQILRRRRLKEESAAVLRQALAAFDTLDASLWAAHARAELGRVQVTPRSGGELTPSERRVGELAAAGLTNREVASALFISPKTVEANLVRVYRKLGIHSRAELGHRMGTTPGPPSPSQ